MQLEWKILKQHIYAWSGAYHDIIAANVTSQGWRSWIDCLNQHYRLEWQHPVLQELHSQVDFRILEAFWAGEIEELSVIKVFSGGVQINVHYMADEVIDCDIDAREIQSEADHKRVLAFMRDLSTTSDRTVVLGLSHLRDDVLISVKGNTTEYSVLRFDR